MKLYYSAGACSMACHIALNESGLSYTATPVTLSEEKIAGGGDYLKVTAKGYVPALELDDGEVLTEGAVIMQYIADRAPQLRLIPEMGTKERYRCQEWLNYIATEVHKGFSPLWIDALPEEAHKIARGALYERFDYLSDKLNSQTYLMGEQYTVADGYLFTILNWTKFLKIEMTRWPRLMGYMETIQSRPATQETMKQEKLI